VHPTETETRPKLHILSDSVPKPKFGRPLIYVHLFFTDRLWFVVLCCRVVSETFHFACLLTAATVLPCMCVIGPSVNTWILVGTWDGSVLQCFHSVKLRAQYFFIVFDLLKFILSLHWTCRLGNRKGIRLACEISRSRVMEGGPHVTSVKSWPINQKLKAVLLAVAGPRVWNCLPAALRAVEDYERFKKLLKHVCSIRLRRLVTFFL